jgi:hypothetical protein
MAMIQVAVDSGPSVGQLLVIMIGTVPILLVMAWAAVKILGPIGQALAHRVGGGGGRDQHQLEDRVEVLSQELDLVRGQLAEVHERLDFAERLLAKGRSADQLPRG